MGRLEHSSEATGYGCVYFGQEAINDLLNDSYQGKRCVVSGSGNVAQYTCEKLLDLGATPLTFSDSSGTVYEKDGFDREKLAIVMDLKNNHRGKRINEYLEHSPSAEFYEGIRPWNIPCDQAYPSATQNEISKSDAEE